MTKSVTYGTGSLDFYK